MRYVTTESCCRDKISKRGFICDGCGGELSPIETQDNSGRPTFWPGCITCGSFTYGVPLNVFKIADSLVRTSGYVAYQHEMKPLNPDDLERWYRSQARGTCLTVWQVISKYEAMNAKEPTRDEE